MAPNKVTEKKEEQGLVIVKVKRGKRGKRGKEKEKKQSPVLTEILLANKRPPITARPVQIACPTMPPNVIPNGFCVVAIAMVVICDLSPHSARKVNVNV